MDDKEFFRLFIVPIMVAGLAVILACGIWESWRPKVSKWGKRTSPHQAAVLHVPERIVWDGVEYDCVLREKEEE